jgi:hypothetical protein
MTVIHEYIKKTPGTVWGYTEEHVIEVILRLSVVRTDLLHTSSYEMQDQPVAEAVINQQQVQTIVSAVIDQNILRVASEDITKPVADPPKTIRRR